MELEDGDVGVWGRARVPNWTQRKNDKTGSRTRSLKYECYAIATELP